MRRSEKGPERLRSRRRSGPGPSGSSSNRMGRCQRSWGRDGRRRARSSARTRTPRKPASHRARRRGPRRSRPSAAAARAARRLAVLDVQDGLGVGIQVQAGAKADPRCLLPTAQLLSSPRDYAFRSGSGPVIHPVIRGVKSGNRFLVEAQATRSRRKTAERATALSEKPVHRSWAGRRTRAGRTHWTPCTRT